MLSSLPSGTLSPDIGLVALGTLPGLLTVSLLLLSEELLSLFSGLDIALPPFWDVPLSVVSTLPLFVSALLEVSPSTGLWLSKPILESLPGLLLFCAPLLPLSEITLFEFELLPPSTVPLGLLLPISFSLLFGTFAPKSDAELLFSAILLFSEELLPLLLLSLSNCVFESSRLSDSFLSLSFLSLLSESFGAFVSVGSSMFGVLDELFSVDSSTLLSTS